MAIADEQTSESPVFYPNEEFRENSHIQSMETYKKMYQKSITQPEQFWREMSEDFYFKSGPKAEFYKYNFDSRKGDIEIKWMEGAITNVCYNVLDRNIEKGRGDRTAIIWEGSEPFHHRKITYNELRSEVCKFANVLKKKGIGKGDRVAVYLPVTIELVVSMLACARIGAIHSVIFAGFSGDSIADRILDCKCKLLITCDGVYRGNKFIHLKQMADHAVQICKEHDHKLNGVIVYNHLKNIPNRSLDEESKNKNIKIGENLNGQLNKQTTAKINGHNPTNKQLNGQVKEQQQLNGKPQTTNAQTGKEKLANEQDKQTNGQVKTLLKNGQLNGQATNNGVNKVVNNGVNSNQQLNNGKSVDVDFEEVQVIENKEEPEPMDTSEPIVPQDVNNNNLLDETFEIETDQNNNIVMIKCKPVENGKVTKEINNNSVNQCKLPANNQQTHLNKTEDKTNENGNQALKQEIKLNGTSSTSSPSTTLNSSSNQQTATPPTATTTTANAQINNSKQSAQIAAPLNNNSKKINEISKLRKICADTVHAAMKRKVDEQTASATNANGLKNEKKILKLSNNGNETPENQQANQAKLNTKQLIDQLTKARNEELSTSPNENDQTPPPQLQQTKKLLNNNCNSSSNNSKIKIPWDPKIDSWWHDLMNQVDDVCEPVWVDAEHPLFILYTSGSTGKPKGVLHTSGGYMVYAATTFKYVFNYHVGDVFFCTADLGWITGHTVNCYGSLANAATIVLFDGTPFYPTASRLWQIVQSHRVNIFYTAPTAIRSLMGCGEKWIKNFDLSSLKLLGTAGECINREAWNWYHTVVGKGRCPIVDTYWSTESGAPLISALPGCTPLKPGSACLPFFGVVPALLDDEGKELQGPASGHLVFKTAWPSMIRTVDGNHQRFSCTYFYRFPGFYCAGDGARRDNDGYYWITGRTDDLLNVSGHLLSTAQVESALMQNDIIVEAAAVSAPHEVKGECIYCYIVLKKDCVYNKVIENELRTSVRHKIGAIASPEVLHVVSALPKTRSGKVMRRLLKKIAIGETDFGDLSTISDETVLLEICETRRIYCY